MVTRRYRVLFFVGPLIATGLLCLAIFDPDPPRGVSEYVGLGYLFGTAFSHASLASAWTAFGPAPLVWRLPLSLIWLTMIPLAVAINVGLHGGPDAAAPVLALCACGQWLIIQVPLWGLAIGYGLKLRHQEDADYGFDPRQWQFGIRQLMIITAVVAIALGIGRLVFTHLGDRINLRGEVPVFIFLAVAAVGITLPLLLAALLQRGSVPGTLLVLVVIGLATAFELPLLRRVHAGPGPQVGHLIGINAFTAGWILVVAVMVRLNGFRLATANNGPATMAGPSGRDA